MSLLRLIPASEAPSARQVAREEFCERWRVRYGEELCPECTRKWWP